MLTTWPPRGIFGMKKWQPWTTPIRLIETIQSHSSSGVSRNSPDTPTPALLTSRSTAGTASANARICSRSETSVRRAITSWPCSRASRSVSASPFSSTSQIAMSAPRRAHSSAVSRPIPLPAPVTTTLLPRRSVVFIRGTVAFAIPMELPALAADAGIRCLPIPTPFAVGRVNCYLLEDEPLTLLDTGPNSGKVLDALERALDAHGHRVEDIELVVLSHQHMDHLGLAGIVARRSGAEVAALEALAPWAAAYGQNMAADDEFAEAIMARHGIPQDVRHALRAVAGGFRAWGAPVTVTRLLSEGDTLELRDRRLRVLHRPGHSPSDTVFVDEDRRLALAGDHLIKHISSNPLIARPLNGETSERPQALVTYLDSMARSHALELDLVLAGDGEPIDDHRAL